ncbi:hypothetical protein MRX96_056143 [Rhipicephalus microplus]
MYTRQTVVWWRPVPRWTTRALDCARVDNFHAHFRAKESDVGSVGRDVVDARDIHARPKVQSSPRGCRVGWRRRLFTTHECARRRPAAASELYSPAFRGACLAVRGLQVRDRASSTSANNARAKASCAATQRIVSFRRPVSCIEGLLDKNHAFHAPFFIGCDGGGRMSD